MRFRLTGIQEWQTGSLEVCGSGIEKELNAATTRAAKQMVRRIMRTLREQSRRRAWWGCYAVSVKLFLGDRLVYSAGRRLTTQEKFPALAAVFPDMK